MMHIMRAVLVPVFLALILSGCSGIQATGGEASMAKAAIQVATLRTISKSESITQEEVLQKIEVARAALDGDQLVTLNDLAAQVVNTDEWERLDPLDRGYITMLFNSIQAESGAGVDHVLGPEDRERLSTVLDWIEEAAAYAVDDG